MPIGNTDTLPRSRFGLFYPLPAFLLALRDAPLKVPLKAGRCKGLFRDLALVFFAGERPKDEELLKDNSSSAGVSTSPVTMGSFHLLQAIGCAT